MTQSQKKGINTVFLQILNVSLLPLVLILFLIKKLFKVTFFRLASSRLGHLAGNNELFLRRLRTGLIKDKDIRHIGIVGRKVCNIQLLTMLRREMTIIQIPQPRLVRSFTKILAKDSLLSKMGLFQILPFNWNEYYEFNNIPPVLRFTKSEEKEGQELLREIGIKDWFVCFHARDPTYTNQFLRKGRTRFNFRDCDINNFLEAARYISEQNGYAVRMGSVVTTKIHNPKGHKIIDYASVCRSDFGDIYLPAKCKFFLGNTAGLYIIPTIFNVPVAHTNLIPLKCPPYRKSDLFIPKKIWSITKNRMLTFKEIINSDIIDYSHSDEYIRAGLRVVENTPHEILDLAVEMDQRLNGTWKPATEDELLQKKFKALFPPTSPCYNFPSRIGAKFLKEHKNLLD